MFSSCVSGLINKFGRAVTIKPSDGEAISTKAFIQPTKNKDSANMGGKFMNMGYLNGRNYLYIGDKNTRLDLFPFDTKIETANETYVAKRAQAVYLGANILYIWAILQAFVEDEFL